MRERGGRMLGAPAWLGGARTPESCRVRPQAPRPQRVGPEAAGATGGRKDLHAVNQAFSEERESPGPPLLHPQACARDTGGQGTARVLEQSWAPGAR